MLGMLPIPLGTSALFLVAVGAMLWLCAPLALVALTVVPATAWAAARSRARLVPATREAQAGAARLAEQVEEAVRRRPGRQGLRPGGAARSASCARAARGLFARPAPGRPDPRRRHRQHSGRRPRSARSVSSPSAAGWHLRGTIGPGTFLAFAAYLAPARRAGPAARELPGHRPSRPGPPPSGYTNSSTPGPTSTERPAAPDALRPPDTVGLELRGVRFGYAQRADPVLDGLSLAVRPGETLALVGPSGQRQVHRLAAPPPLLRPAGPSSVRVGPAGAAIDVRDLSLAELRSTRPRRRTSKSRFLFSCSVRDNIAYGRPDATDAQVQVGRRCRTRRDGVHRAALPDGVRHRGRRARPDPVRRAAAARRAGPCDAGRPAGAGPGRRDLRRGRRYGGRHPPHPARRHRWPYDPADRTPPLHPRSSPTASPSWTRAAWWTPAPRKS
ncbi:hypothetical protein SRIMM317S_02906 [Streptomyces rimosus subsp. rimosus]